MPNEPVEKVIFLKPTSSVCPKMNNYQSFSLAETFVLFDAMF